MFCYLHFTIFIYNTCKFKQKLPEKQVNNSLKTHAKKEIINLLFDSSPSYYDEDYWNWQKSMGKIGGKLEAWKFREHIKPGSSCLDFGAGGGFLLNVLYMEGLCTDVKGIEINPHAIKSSKKDFNIILYPKIEFILDNSIDIIFSNHALEHALCTWCELVRLKYKLKQNGKIIFVVPSASNTDDVYQGTPDVNNHLHSWSPNTLANLFNMAGYVVDNVVILKHQWPENAEFIFDTKGEKQFIVEGEEANKNSPLLASVVQIKIVAHKN